MLILALTLACLGHQLLLWRDWVIDFYFGMIGKVNINFGMIGDVDFGMIGDVNFNIDFDVIRPSTSTLV